MEFLVIPSFLNFHSRTLFSEIVYHDEDRVGRLRSERIFVHGSGEGDLRARPSSLAESLF